MLQQQRERLLHTWESAEIDGLEEHFDDMKRLIAQDTRIKAIVQDEKQLGSFAEAWAPFNNNHFEPLKRFFGGLATVFPRTAAVESDFLLINWERMIILLISLIFPSRGSYTANNTLNCLV